MAMEQNQSESRRSDSNTSKLSRLPGFYGLAITERQSIASQFADLSPNHSYAISNFGALTPELVDIFIENAVGTMPLPLGIATNFTINGEDILIPMAVEESSVLAAASHGAKLARAGGGFTTSSTKPIGTGQVQVILKEPCDWDAILKENKATLIALANQGHDRLIARGGGACDLSWRHFPDINSVVIYLDVDTRDAMGANMINSMCERLGKQMPQILPCEVGLCILTNLTDKRLARATCIVPAKALHSQEMSGETLVERIEQAYLFADADVYRACTHNKGVMNGIDPVAIATGNDWRAIEAGAHAYSCRKGTYKPMTQWRRNENGDLEGFIELPMAVGTVGGVTKLHPTAKAALRLLGNPGSQGLAEILCAVGLAQNLSALRALASEGIQKGHMYLHQSNMRLSRDEKKD